MTVYLCRLQPAFCRLLTHASCLVDELVTLFLLLLKEFRTLLSCKPSLTQGICYSQKYMLLWVTVIAFEKTVLPVTRKWNVSRVILRLAVGYKKTEITTRTYAWWLPATMGSQSGSPCSTLRRVSSESLTAMKLVVETDGGIKFSCVNCLGLIFGREWSLPIQLSLKP